MNFEQIEIVVLMPVFNDWESASLICKQLDEELSSAPEISARLVLVNDGSTRAGSNDHLKLRFERIAGAEIVHLRRNLGHQRAIAVGLSHVYESYDPIATVVMDSDGEDKTDDVWRLLDVFLHDGASRTVFAERRKRSESIVFRISYFVYRSLHRILTGHSVRVGNFSVLPREHLSSLMGSSELWNHYAAAVFKCRLSHISVPTSRGDRLGGKSHMDFSALVTHGLSAISVFREIVSTRLLIAITGLSSLAVVLIGVVVLVRLTTELAIPGWATYSAGLLMLLLAQMVTLAFVLVFFVLASRDSQAFIPGRDCKYFIREIEQFGE